MFPLRLSALQRLSCRRRLVDYGNIWLPCSPASAEQKHFFQRNPRSPSSNISSASRATHDTAHHEQSSGDDPDSRGHSDETRSPRRSPSPSSRLNSFERAFPALDSISEAKWRLLTQKLVTISTNIYYH